MPLSFIAGLTASLQAAAVGKTKRIMRECNGKGPSYPYGFVSLLSIPMGSSPFAGGLHPQPASLTVYLRNENCWGGEEGDAFNDFF